MNVNPQNDKAAHRETSDVNFGGVVGFAVGLVATSVVIFAVVWSFYGYLKREAARPVPPEFPLAASAMRRLPPEPRLQTDPRDDLASLRGREDRILTSYGWVDKSAGVVRIPIDEAMKLTVERGLPSR